MTDAPPFGALAPDARQDWARRRAMAMPTNFFGKQAASAFKRIAGANQRRAFDVDVFEIRKARLHPYDNACERKVYCTPQFWDARERALLASLLSAHPRDDFIFVDVGANVGLYSLFVSAAAEKAGKAARLISVEPEPVVRSRMEFNFAASRIENETLVLPWAAVGAPQPVVITANPSNRGENRVASDGDAPQRVSVDGRTLIEIFDAARIDRADAMKIDIEGAEYPALEAMFRNAPQPRWPQLILMETFHDQAADSAERLCLDAGYAPVLKTKLNTVFEHSG